MIPRIKSLTVRDFRSIRGTVTVPMDSPIVLIHGKNGAGKTSLLSAIELALTGRLSALDREHLVHKQATDASISLTVDGLTNEPSVTEFTIKDGVIKGAPFLTPLLARHYSERCYLAQSTLSRLLDIYQTKDAATSTSPLTLFVKELLGLDSLDNLIDGLHDAGDVRRLRGGSNRYWEVRDQLPNLEAEIARVTRELAAVDAQVTQLNASIREQIAPHWQVDVDQSADSLHAFLATESQETELQRLAQVRRDILATLDQWSSFESGTSIRRLEDAEQVAATEDKALRGWLDTTGQKLTAIFQQLSAYLTDLPSPIQNHPKYAVEAATRMALAELGRCDQLLARDSEIAKQIIAIEGDKQKLAARLLQLDEQVSQHSQHASQLAQALSSLLPHVHTDECPACGRDFGEISDTPLVGFLAGKVAALTQSAGLLAALSVERSDTLGTIEARSRSLASLQATVVSPESLAEVSIRASRLRNALSSLDNLTEEIVAGEQYFEKTSEASMEVGYLRARDQQSSSTRQSANLFARQLALEDIGASESLRDALRRFQNHVVLLENGLSAKELARRQVESSLRELQLKLQSKESVRSQLDILKSELAALTSAKISGDRAIEQARELLRIAQAERTQIVRRVFNESLNAAWRELFIRLAPEEPFVPAFVLPDTLKGALEAKLETMYRRGGKGGNPRAMLSAGNLNTAALTLFFALHLSVKPSLPWLVIDDPVQSMDEVHISQFAALLRMVARQHQRQVVIAVHEKPLFDYLALELSAAFDGDRLITAELGRTADDSSICDCLVRTWRPDLALAA